MIAADVMTALVVTVTPETTVNAVAKLLVERNISALPVVDAENRIVGIVTEGDLLRRKELGSEKHRRPLAQFFTSSLTLDEEYIRSHGGTAADIMRTNVVTASPETPLSEIVDLFEKHRIKRVPIVEDGRLVGIVSRTDLVRALASTPPSAPPEHVTDGQIRRKLLAELSQLRWSHHHGNNVVVKKGVVHFWGLVDSETELDAMRVAAKSVPGVVDVVNHTVVASDYPPIGM